MKNYASGLGVAIPFRGGVSGFSLKHGWAYDMNELIQKTQKKKYSLAPALHRHNVYHNKFMWSDCFDSIMLLIRNADMILLSPANQLEVMLILQAHYMLSICPSPCNALYGGLQNRGFTELYDSKTLMYT